MLNGSLTHVFTDGAVPDTPITISTVATFGARGRQTLGFVVLKLSVKNQAPLQFRLMMDLEKDRFIDLPENGRDRRILKKCALAVTAVIKARLQETA